AQRAGRAARQGPGVAYRLWEEASHAGREAFDPPEMLTSDLAPLVLALAQWGVAEPASLAWLDPPPPAAVSAARERLAWLGVLDGEGRITEHGRRIARLSMEPWQAAMLLFGAEQGVALEAAKLALLLQERGLGGRGEDLAQRLARWDGDRSSRAEAARELAQGWAKRAKSTLPGEPASGGGGRSRGGSRPANARQLDSAPPLGILLALALPDNLARRRDASGESWLSAGGRGYTLDAASPLAGAQWLAIGDAQGRAQAARITGALPLGTDDVERWLADRIDRRSALRWAGDRVEARLERKIGAITIASGPDPAPDTEAIVDMLVHKAVESLGNFLPGELLARARFAGVA